MTPMASPAPLAPLAPMTPPREEELFVGYLRSRGLRVTAERRALLREIFAQHRSHRRRRGDRGGARRGVVDLARHRLPESRSARRCGPGPQGSAARPPLSSTSTSTPGQRHDHLAAAAAAASSSSSARASRRSWARSVARTDSRPPPTSCRSPARCRDCAAPTAARAGDVPDPVAERGRAGRRRADAALAARRRRRRAARGARALRGRGLPARRDGAHRRLPPGRPLARRSVHRRGALDPHRPRARPSPTRLLVARRSRGAPPMTRRRARRGPRRPSAPAAARPALLGNPNTGKTTLFNRLCGLRAKTANFPGTTTDLRVGQLSLPARRRRRWRGAGSPPRSSTCRASTASSSTCPSRRSRAARSAAERRRRRRRPPSWSPTPPISRATSSWSASWRDAACRSWWRST